MGAEQECTESKTECLMIITVQLENTRTDLLGKSSTAMNETGEGCTDIRPAPCMCLFSIGQCEVIVVFDWTVNTGTLYKHVHYLYESLV